MLLYLFFFFIVDGYFNQLVEQTKLQLGEIDKTSEKFPTSSTDVVKTPSSSMATALAVIPNNEVSSSSSKPGSKPSQVEDEILYELPVYNEVDEEDYCLLLPWNEYLNAVEGKSKNLILYIM